MDDAFLARIERIYAAIDAIEEEDPNKLKATVTQTDNTKQVFHDFRGGLSDYELSNQAHMVIHNIANLSDHLRKWAAHIDHDKAKVNQTISNSLDLQIVMDLSNNDKHGYPRREDGHSGKHPQLININRVMRLQTQAKKGSKITMTIDAEGVPKFIDDGTAKAVVNGDVVDKHNNRIGDFYDIANKAIEAWEQLLVDFGLNQQRIDPENSEN